jgi:hypothetical protein
MCATPPTNLSNISAIAASVSAFLAFLGLIYNAYQLKQNSANTRKQMYLQALARYSELRKMVVDSPPLGAIYDRGFDPATLTVQQNYYVHLLIAFCEGLYLTDQINAFKEFDGGSWENFIRHTFDNTAVGAIWRQETQTPGSSDYAMSFIGYIMTLSARR